MALYEYRCRTCDERFEVQRPMTAVVTETPCPQGHVDTVKMLSMFATSGVSSSGSASAGMAGPAMGGGGCCGGACGCR